MRASRMMRVLATALDVAFLALHLLLGAVIVPQANMPRAVALSAVTVVTAIWHRGRVLCGVLLRSIGAVT